MFREAAQRAERRAKPGGTHGAGATTDTSTPASTTARACVW
jgi:hypothetical protein